MSVNKFPMTSEGAKKLREELHQLKAVERPLVISAISEARAHGDLKENAEYHAAREQQGFVEGRIREISGKLSNSQVIDITKIQNTGKVVFGTTVTLLNLDTEEKVVYKIVGDDEANLKDGKVSVNSPLTRAIIGKFEGDSVEVMAPGGVISYEVYQVDYI